MENLSTSVEKINIESLSDIIKKIQANHGVMDITDVMEIKTVRTKDGPTKEEVITPILTIKFDNARKTFDEATRLGNEMRDILPYANNGSNYRTNMRADLNPLKIELKITTEQKKILQQVAKETGINIEYKAEAVLAASRG